MNEIKIFESQQFGKIRTSIVDGEPWFVAADVCRALEIGNPTMALSRLDDDEKALISIEGLSKGNDKGNIVNEPGLYNLVLGSRKPEAKEFKRWITHEVIPSIRKHGAYMTPDTIEKVLTDPDTIIKLATQLKFEQEQRKTLELENAYQKQQIGELQPKASYVDRILDNKGLVTITQIAKDYGMSGQAMNRKLHEMGIQYNQSGQWLLYSKYHSCGYTHSKTIQITRSDGRPDVTMETKWTQKGRLFLYEELKRIGIFPVVERS